MLWGDTVRLALRALLVHKLRTALTLTGLIIGVTSLILVVTIVQGANVYVERKIVNLGADIFQVSKMPLVATDMREVIRGRKNPDITLDDWRAIEAGCRLCRGVGAQGETLSRIRTEAESLADVSIRGQTANMAWISELDIARGRFFTDAEQRAAVPVAILGDGIVERLFAGRDPLGKSIRIGGEEFSVIAVAEKIGSILGQDQDNFVILPIDSFMKLYGLRHSLVLQIKAVPPMQPAQDEVRQILRAHRHLPPSAPDNFFFATADTYLALWSDISSVFFIVLVLISSVASVVGGIVIMNITLVSVTERTKEIGLRRSVGARQRDIARQFLLEVLAQCLAGGLFGVLLGFALALLLSQFTPFPADVELWVALMGMLLASAIALTFGVYPAWRAAKLDPVVALRTE
jgi:putative ABC transport system permease protein